MVDEPPTKLTWAYLAKLLSAALLPFGPPVAASLAFLIAGERQATTEYFSAVSQILPLLLLVLVLEQRYFFRRYSLPPRRRPYGGPRGERIAAVVDRVVLVGYPLLVLLFLGAGEWAALAALASSGAVSENAFAFTVAGMVGGFAAICLLPATSGRQQDAAD